MEPVVIRPVILLNSALLLFAILIPKTLTPSRTIKGKNPRTNSIPRLVSLFGTPRVSSFLCLSLFLARSRKLNGKYVTKIISRLAKRSGRPTVLRSLIHYLPRCISACERVSRILARSTRRGVATFFRDSTCPFRVTPIMRTFLSVSEGPYVDPRAAAVAVAIAVAR